MERHPLIFVLCINLSLPIKQGLDCLRVSILRCLVKWRAVRFRSRIDFSLPIEQGLDCLIIPILRCLMKRRLLIFVMKGIFTHCEPGIQPFI